MGKVKIVSASAGSGKTYNLTYEYIRNVIENPALYRHILAVTFTNKATEEMKERILSKINELASGRDKAFSAKIEDELGLSAEVVASRASDVRSKILHDYSHFSVMTIDKFFQGIIRSFIKELGIDLNFNLELPVDTLLKNAADRLIDEVAIDAELQGWVISFVKDKIEDGKSWNINKELQDLGKELFREERRNDKLPEDLKDKLKTIVNRSVADAKKAKQTIATKASEFIKTLQDNGLTPDSLNGGSRGVGGYVAKVAAGALIHPKDSRSARTALEENKWSSAKSPHKATIEAIVPELHRTLSELWTLFDDGLKTINSAELIRDNFRSYALLPYLEAKIAEVSAEENIVHISEINDLLAKLIAGNDTPFIYEKTGNHFSHYMIDEFQDTSSLQWNNFIPLLENAVAESEKTPVMLVGDVKQSIYRWRGGDWSILSRKAKERFSETYTQSLQENYRSRREIVEFNNAIIEQAVAQENNKLNDTLQEAFEGGLISAELRAEYTDIVREAYSDCAQDPMDKEEGGYVTLTYYDKAADGTSVPPVIEAIADAQRRGYSAGDIAILVRRNIEGANIAEILLQYKKDNPDSGFNFDIITQDALIISKSSVVNFVISCLYLSRNANDDINKAIYNRFLGEPFEAAISESNTLFLNEIKLKSPEEAFENIVIRYNLSACNAEIAYLQALHEQIMNFSNTNIADIPLFLEWWEETGKKKPISMPANKDAITIDTIHRSKGLGYKFVIIPYCDWSMTTKPRSIIWAEPANEYKDAISKFPVEYKDAMGNSVFSEDYYREYVMAHIDNLNLFYVALTRAKEELHIMLPRSATKESKRETLGQVISRSVTLTPPAAAIGSYAKGEVATSDESTVIRFGRPATVTRSNTKQRGIDIGFPTFNINSRAAVSLGSQRYFDEAGDDGRLTPRNYGILLHKVFESIATRKDIDDNINRLRIEGSVSESELNTLTANINEAFKDETIKSWFETDWETVRNESEIIVPAHTNYRPDRVMISGKQAVVVDYKFGLETSENHKRQVRKYVELLKKMGYDDASGYLWYVSLARVEQV